MTTSTEVKLNKELSWYARLTYIIKNSKQKGLHPRAWKHKALKRIDMYNEMRFDEKEQAKVELRATDFTGNE